MATRTYTFRVYRSIAGAPTPFGVQVGPDIVVAYDTVTVPFQPSLLGIAIDSGNSQGSTYVVTATGTTADLLASDDGAIMLLSVGS